MVDVFDGMCVCVCYCCAGRHSEIMITCWAGNGSFV